MPDISMCFRTDCGKRGSCYRYLAYPCEHRQSWGHFEIPEGRDWCSAYWKCSGRHCRTLEEADGEATTIKQVLDDKNT